MKNFGNLLLACMAALLGACAGESAGKCDAVVRIDADSVVNRGYIGNGVQWDPMPSITDRAASKSAMPTERNSMPGSISCGRPLSA